MQQKINALSRQIDRLEKLGQANDNERAQLEMERLTRAEQRTESLRTQLVDVESKLGELQPRLDEIEYAMKPENIERAAAVLARCVLKRSAKRGDANWKAARPGFSGRLRFWKPAGRALKPQSRLQTLKWIGFVAASRRARCRNRSRPPPPKCGLRIILRHLNKL